MSQCYIRIKGDVLVGVPAQPSCMTTWILLEQEDWFEKEIVFVRRLLKPGMRAVDIGANLGVYALTMAKLVARGGKVWAFEPTSECAAALRRSAEHNDFTNLQLVQMALSDQEGAAALHRHGNSELNSLVHTAEAGTLETETVMVSTLDRQQSELDWGAIDFIKIDAEGCGLNILTGGARFFAEQSPIVMFEASDSRFETDRATLPAAFRALGFDIYRLVGPDTMLAPVTALDQLTDFDLNLFACKPDRAAQLAAQGLLALPSETRSSFPPGGGRALFKRQPYARSFGSLIARPGAYSRTLDAYALWRDERAGPDRRYAALRGAFAAAREAAEERPSLARISTVARIAFEAGDRQFAIGQLRRAISLLRSDPAPPDEPFFPAASRYDAIDPAGMAQAWLLAAIFEAFETTEYWSGCFKPVEKQALPALDQLQASPFASAPMERRRQLQRWRAGLSHGQQAVPILAHAAPDNLNPHLWTRG